LPFRTVQLPPAAGAAGAADPAGATDAAPAGDPAAGAADSGFCEEQPAARITMSIIVARTISPIFLRVQRKTDFIPSHPLFQASSNQSKTGIECCKGSIFFKKINVAI
jgi:hypothetical protein